jgi:Protein of unknown function (DUF3810)
MNKWRKWIIVSVLLLICVSINLYSSNAVRVENGFSITFYPKFANFLRLLFGWLPFSFGDILYGMLVVYLAIKLFKLCRFIFSKKRRVHLKERLLPSFISFIKIACIVYIVFNLFWGINYNRIGIAKQLDLKIEKYTVEDLKCINEILVEKINTSKAIILKEKLTYTDNKSLFEKTTLAYQIAAKKYPFLVYKNCSIKSSLWGWLGNYTGFLGYYNPFTGEAQVNTTVPKFTQPFTSCHEVAHQLGYAKEMEANFVGYLTATASTDETFRYSVYVDLFGYANRTLLFADMKAAIKCRKNLLPEVITDFKERRDFNKAHTSFAEPIISDFYSKFLQMNEQPLGILSYDEVTAFIIAYYKKYGNI